MPPNVSPSTMFIRDNIEILRGLDNECIDLIYLDPPFNSNHNYAAPIGSEAAGAEFKDIWTLDDVDVQWIGMLHDQYPNLHAILKAVPDDSDKSYLAYMAERLLEIHRILKPTGCIYLHCDPTMNAWLRTVLDAIFGKKNRRNEIVWHYYNVASTSRNFFGRKHDTIFFYAKSAENGFNWDDMREPYSSNSNWVKASASYGDDRYAPNERGKLMHDVWRMPALNNMSKERTGYPTQKPLALLNRIITASSNKGEWVLDPFCGCATTCVATHLLGRKWIGIDISPTADILVRKRIDQELRNDWVASGEPVYEPIVRTDIPIRSGTKVIPREYKETLYGIQGGFCNLCKEHFKPRNLTIDHIIPKSKGGQDLEGNLQLLCQACNSSKGAKDMAQMKALFASYVSRLPV